MNLLGRRRDGLILLAAIAVAGIAGCRRAPRGVLLFSFDAARADHFGVYGYRRPTTPTVDAVARGGGLVYRNFIATAAWTLPSFAALFTSKYPVYCNVIYGADGLNPADLTLPQLFHSAGFATAGFCDSDFLSPVKGFGRGFDVYRDFSRHPGGHEDRYAALITDVASFLKSAEGKPFFLFVHTFLPHSPYTPPAEFVPPFSTPGNASAFAGTTEELKAWDKNPERVSAADRQRAIDLYDANLRYGDWVLSEVLRRLREAGRFEATDIFITSDHGEAFAEHGRYLHESTVYEEMVHVPLIVHLAAGRRLVPDTATLADNVDLLPTMAALAGLPMPAGHFQGVSLFAGDRARQKPYAMSYTLLLAASLLRGPATAYIETRGSRPEYYDLSRDPAERQNRISEVDAAQLKRRRGSHETSLARRAPVSEMTLAPVDSEAMKRLQALGYLNAGSSEPRVDLPLSDTDYRLSYSGLALPATARAGTRIRGEVVIRNMGSRPIASGGRFPVSVSYHVRNDRGVVLIFDGPRSHLGPMIRPGESRRVEFDFDPPRKPGKYEVEIDVVQEGVSWFSWKGCAGPRRVIRVRTR
jgi:arylsulfatase A-like enzyme